MHIKEEDSNTAIFSCPEEGCVKTFERYSSMQRHLDCGKHQRALERYTRDFKQRERGRRRGPQALRENPNNHLRMTGGKKFDVLSSAPT